MCKNNWRLYHEPVRGSLLPGALHWWLRGIWCTLARSGAGCPWSSPARLIKSLQTDTQRTEYIQQVNTVTHKQSHLFTAKQRCTLAAELDTPWVTLRMRPPTLPYLMSSDTPSVTSFSRPMGFPRKSTEPRIWAAWLISSYRQETLHSNEPTQTGQSNTSHGTPACVLPVSYLSIQKYKIWIFQDINVTIVIIKKQKY